MPLDSEEPLEYYEKSMFNSEWKPAKGKRCTPVDDVVLSTDKAPRSARPATAPPKPKEPPSPRKRPSLSSRVCWKSVQRSMNGRTARPRSSRKGRRDPWSPRIIPAKLLPPFDLQDVPKAMDGLNWPVSAKLQRKWFAGELNYPTTDKGAVLGVNQDGQPFRPV